jgi:hypothetical protein
MKRYKDTNLQVTKDGKVFGPRGERKVVLRSDGYTQVGTRTANYLTHRLVAEMYVPNPNNKPQVNHKDGDKTNNHYTNLEWVTNSENQKHAYDNGFKSGWQGSENPPTTKLTEKDVETAFYLKSIGWMTKDIAKELGVAPNTMSYVLNKKSWRSIV